MQVLEKFKELQSKISFKIAVGIYHVFALTQLALQFVWPEKYSYLDILTIINILLLATYWKLFAKQKRQQYEEKR